MKAMPVKLDGCNGYIQCDIGSATHVTIRIPSMSYNITLPVITKGSRKETPCWTWNGDTDKPTLKPSVLHNSNHTGFRCHCFVNDGCAVFLSDCSHDMKNKTVELCEVGG